VSTFADEPGIEPPDLPIDEIWSDEYPLPHEFVSPSVPESINISGYVDTHDYYGICFDNTYVYICDYHADSSSIIIMNAQTNTLDRILDLQTITGYTSIYNVDIAIDGNILNIISSSYIYQIDVTTDTFISPRIKPGLPASMRGIFIKDNLYYIVCYQDPSVYIYNPAEGSYSIFTDLPENSNPGAITLTSDGFWIVDRYHDTLYLLNQNNGQLIRQAQLTENNQNAIGIYEDVLYMIDDVSPTINPYFIQVVNGYITRSEPETYTISYVMDITNNNPTTGMSNIQVKAAHPVSSIHQTIESISYFGAPHEIQIDMYGQEIVVFSVDSLLAGQSISIGYEVQVVLWAVSFYLTESFVSDSWSAPTGSTDLYRTDTFEYLAMDTSTVTNLALSLSANQNNPIIFARTIRDEIFTRLEYNKDSTWDNADAVLNSGLGSCSEYSFVMAAMFRLNGYPVRFVGSSSGLRYNSPGYIDKVYHRWIEFYVPKIGWLPMDANGNDSGAVMPFSNEFVPGFRHRCFVVSKGGCEDSEYLGKSYINRRSYYWDVSGGDSSLVEWDTYFVWTRVY